ncbi:SLC13 family permease [Georgenia sp. Z1491]|uniref:SLC13 family permease n=1 Tax=Georgenia sp. Z1491 TaxID=3416707 RepID=UPI003CF2E76C
MSTPEVKESTSRAAGLDDLPADPRTRNRRWIGLALGVVGAFVIYFIFPKELSAELVATLTENEIEPSGHHIAITAAVAVLMGVWWMTEAIPLAATALVPLVAFPGLGVVSIGDTAAPYASPTIFLFLGGFFLALTMQRWNLHRRIALGVVLAVGTKPKMLVLGFMVATGFLTMWVSNTATAVMMMPIGLSVLALVGTLRGDDTKRSNFGTALMLGIAYSSSIMSVSTLIGTPPNALLRANLADNYDINLNFGTWMLFATPLAIVFTLLCWLLLVNVVFKPEMKEIPGGREVIQEEYRKLGPMSRQEKMTLVIFAGVAISWVTVPLVWPESNFSDEVIAMILALVLFLVPADVNKGVQLLDWDTAKEVPWDILLLFGGGLSLSAAFTATGLSQWIGEAAGGLEGAPVILIVAGVTALVIFLTEMTSNTATAAAFLPIMGGVATGMNVDVMLLMVPVALAATCAFMLPVATPPNAIVYGSGYIKISQMVKAGLWLNLSGIVLITLTVMTLGNWVLGIAM